MIPTGHVRPARAGGGVVFVDVQTTLDLQHAKAYTNRLRTAVSGLPPARVTGQPAIQRDLDPVLRRRSPPGRSDRNADHGRRPAFTFLGLSLAVLIPFVFAACAIAASLGIV